jgi:hypothetical protein
MSFQVFSKDLHKILVLIEWKNECIEVKREIFEG